MLDAKPLLDWTGGPAFAWVVGAALLYWLGGRHGAYPASRRRGPLADGVLRRRPGDDRRSRSTRRSTSSPRSSSGCTWSSTSCCSSWRPRCSPWRGRGTGCGTACRSGFGVAPRTLVVRSPRLAPLRRVASVLQDPLPSWLAFNVTFLAWHLPAAYDATLHSQFVHALEHAMFFGTALLFWTRVIDSPPWRSPLAEVPRAVYVGLAMVVSWMLAIAFAVSTAPVYAPYAAEASRPGGLTALADQQLAAGVMWVPGLDPVGDRDPVRRLPMASAEAVPGALRRRRPAPAAWDPGLIRKEDGAVATTDRDLNRGPGDPHLGDPARRVPRRARSGTCSCFAAGIPSDDRGAGRSVVTRRALEAAGLRE